MIKYKYKITKNLDEAHSVEGVGIILELPDFIPTSIISVLEDYQLKTEAVEFNIKTDTYSYEFVKI